MKKLSRFLAFTSAFFGLLTLIPSPKGRAGGALWLPKLMAGAWAPFLAIAGGVGALIGLLRGDREALVNGIFGAFAGIRHTARVTKRSNEFDLAFGRDWEQKIQPHIWNQLSRPYELLQPAKAAGPIQRDIMIEGETPVACDLWLPPSDVKQTGLGIIYLHGGLWQAGDKNFLSHTLFTRLVNQGHAVLDVAYSLAPEADMTRMLTDVKRAVLWLKKNGTQVGIDPNKVVLMGNAGGGHLALLAAYTANQAKFQPKRSKADSSVRAVISIAGVTDLESYFYEYGESNPRQPQFSSQITEDMLPRVFDRTRLDALLTRSRIFPAYRYSNMPGGPLLLVNLLGGTLNEAPKNYKLYSPLTHVGPSCPPTLQIFGGEDFVISPSQGRSLHQALMASGIPSVYIEIPETVHAFDQYYGVSGQAAPAAQSAFNDIEQFLALMA